MPIITKPSEYFDAKLRTGAGGGSVTVSGIGFRPDLVWTKARNSSYDHMLADSVRGTTKAVRSNLAAGELTADSWGYLSAFNSDGYTAVPGSANFNSYGGSGVTYVDWMWKAGGTAVTNTAGSITSQVSANPTSGFSIVTYTGTGGAGSVGHGLGVAPKMIIIKSKSSATSWRVYLENLGITKYLVLDTDAASATASMWGSPTDTTFIIGGTGYEVNESDATYVAYCFAEVAGYSKFGTYTGTGAGESNGPFVYCGFRPALIIVKVDTLGYNWAMMDNERPGYNSISFRIMADVANEDTTSGDPQLDFLSNGFKLRAGNANYAGTVYYMAFAESPFKYASAR